MTLKQDEQGIIFLDFEPSCYFFIYTYFIIFDICDNLQLFIGLILIKLKKIINHFYVSVNSILFCTRLKN